jgi:acetylornithine/N-succinyldiaminopimelate aminotransferase
MTESFHLNEVYPLLNFVPKKGDGAYLYTECGREILDLYGGHAVTSLGYNHPDLNVAINKQLKDLIFQSNAVDLPIRELAAKNLITLAPDSLHKVFFVNSGAEANENALRLALKITKRKQVVAFEHGFHGRTAAAASVTWNSKKWYGFPHLPMETIFLPRGDLASLEQINEKVAAVIIEPVQGISGAYPFDKGFLQALEARCKAVGAMLIADEVQCGMGRCGQPYCSSIANLKPDIITLAKGLGGGIPCGAVLMSKAIAEELTPGELGSTFGGGPVACAAINVVTHFLAQSNFIAHINEVSNYIKKNCVVGPILKIQGRGLLLGMQTEVKAIHIRDKLLEKNILVGTSSDPYILRLLPPLVIEAKHIDHLIEALKGI